MCGAQNIKLAVVFVVLHLLGHCFISQNTEPWINNFSSLPIAETDNKLCVVVWC